MKYTDKVRKFLEEHGYTLHSERVDEYFAEIDVTCPQGHFIKGIKYGNLRASLRYGRRGCRQCYIESFSVRNPKFKGKTRDEHRKEMKEELFRKIRAEGYEVISEDKPYKNNQTEFKVQCGKGHAPYNTTKNSWDLGKRCRGCFAERMQKSFEEIARELAEKDCELLEWNGSTEKMLYICECGNKHWQLIGSWREGHRCFRCASEKAKETLRKNKLIEMEKHFAEGK